jgi:hypothetical protein
MLEITFFEALDEELFNRVFALETAHEVWMQLKEIHVGNKKIREEKYELLKVELNESECILGWVCLLKVSMLSMLLTFPSRKSSGKFFKHSPSQDTTSSRHFSLRRISPPYTITEVVNKICSHEMFMMEDMESSTSHSRARKDLALKASEKIKSRKINGKPPSSSSESEDKSEFSEAESDDAMLALLMKRTTRMLSKIGKKGYNYDPKKQKFRASRRNSEGSNRKCYNCGSYDHLSYDCTKPDKRVSSSSKKNDENEKDAKYYNKSSSKKRTSNKPYHKKKGEHRSLLVNEWVTGGETSSESSESEEEKNKKIAAKLSWTMKSLHSHLHLCVSWQSTPR